MSGRHITIDVRVCGGKSQLCQAGPDRLRFLIEQTPRPRAPIGVYPEAVSLEAREHVQVKVEDLLKRCLPVRQENVHALTSQTRAP
ncbi:hypothetical protein GCM10018953_14220 [Streptosporangium nondiastaticum]